VPVYVTYEKGTRRLFAAAKRVLSPPGVEGVSLPLSAEQVQDKGKWPLHDEELQEGWRWISFLFRMMTPIWAHKAQNSMS